MTLRPVTPSHYLVTIALWHNLRTVGLRETQETENYKSPTHSNRMHHKTNMLKVQPL